MILAVHKRVIQKMPRLTGTEQNKQHTAPYSSLLDSFRGRRVHESSFPWFSEDCHRTFSACVTFIRLLLSCLPPPHRGDSGVSERAAGDLSQFAVQARALSVHPQASQWLCGSFPATAPGRGQRHRPGSHLLHGYVHKHRLLYTRRHCIHLPRQVIHMHVLTCFQVSLYSDAVKCSRSSGFASEFNTTACTVTWFFSPRSAQRVHYTGATATCNLTLSV